MALSVDIVTFPDGGSALGSAEVLLPGEEGFCHITDHVAGPDVKPGKWSACVVCGRQFYHVPHSWGASFAECR